MLTDALRLSDIDIISRTGDDLHENVTNAEVLRKGNAAEHGNAEIH